MGHFESPSSYFSVVTFVVCLECRLVVVDGDTGPDSPPPPHPCLHGNTEVDPSTGRSTGNVLDVVPRRDTPRVLRLRNEEVLGSSVDQTREESFQSVGGVPITRVRLRWSFLHGVQGDGCQTPLSSRSRRSRSGYKGTGAPPISGRRDRG